MSLDYAIAAIKFMQADERECLACFGSHIRHGPMIDAAKRKKRPIILSHR